MYNMYNVIEGLCNSKGIKVGKMCADLEISRGILGDLKAGRTKSLSAQNLEKISGYFGVSSDFILGKEKAPTPEGERTVSDDDIKFALFGGDGDITDAMFDEVKRFAQMVKLREEAEKEKK